LDAPQLDGTGEIRLESVDRASGYFSVHADGRHPLARRSRRLDIPDGRDSQKRADLIAERLTHWKSIKNT
jgi:hypothetical protein